MRGRREVFIAALWGPTEDKAARSNVADIVGGAQAPPNPPPPVVCDGEGRGRPIIRTVCTRVQFAADACPKGAIYGKVKVYAPLVQPEPLEGLLYLRSSSHPLPDLVVAIEGPPSLPVKVAVAARIDSVKGGTRATFEQIPDVPLQKAVFSFQGAKKGLLLNSRDICASTNRATALIDGQNGKTRDARPVLGVRCKGHKPHKH